MWLLHEDVAREIEQARRDGYKPTAEQLEAFARETAQADAIAQAIETLRASGEPITVARVKADANGLPRGFKVAGSECEISIAGVLTKRPDYWYRYYDGGNCAYSDILAALALAESDPSIKQITLRIDSPGGEVDGLLAVMDAIYACTKPVTARASMATSAAYGIASQCKRIEADDAASEFGSIGVCTTYRFWADEERIEIVNEGSEKKRPDPRTDEGKQQIREHLNQHAAWFVETIARGRSDRASKAIDADAVLDQYGNGAVVLAPDARKSRMIDGFVAQRTPSGNGARAESNPEPSASEQPGQVAQEQDDMTTKILAKTLGLSESASEAEVAAAAVRLAADASESEKLAADLEKQLTAEREAHKSTRTLLERIESVLEAKGEAVLAALQAHVDNTGKLEKLTQEMAEAAKTAETEKRARLEKQGTDEGKLNPALIETYKTQPIANLEAYLKHAVAHSVVPKSHTQPKTEPGAKTSGSSGDALTWNGKTFAELKPAQRAALKREDKELHDAMRAQFMSRAS